MSTKLSEELLETWLLMSQTISNRRLTEGGISYNEAMVCHILYKNRQQPEQKAQKQKAKRLTATDLCLQTKMLKSQMNATLVSMEKKKLIDRVRSLEDKRQTYIELREENLAVYLKEHERILALVDEVIQTVGEEKIAATIPILREITKSVQQYAGAIPAEK